MSLVTTASFLAEEAAASGGEVPSIVFGLFAFAVLGVALIVTLMINVNR